MFDTCRDRKRADLLWMRLRSDDVCFFTGAPRRVTSVAEQAHEPLESVAMHADHLIASLERFGRSLPVLLEGVSSEDARWKPADGAWSILEIVRHLGDEEVEDFRMRLELTLRDPNLDWPGINPEQTAKDRKYNDANFAEAVQRFVDERRKSVAWLKSLKHPDWSTTKTHPKLGSMRAGDLLVSWAAHDHLHLKQIAKRLFQLAARDGGEFVTNYAGQWGA